MGTSKRTANGWLFGFGSFVVVVALYVPYFFLPVMTWDHSISGKEGFITSFLLPIFWPIALGHLALWFGSVCLLFQRWRAAGIAGIGALVISFESWFFLLGGFPGQYMKLASMITLVAAGFIGAAVFRPASMAKTTNPAEPSLGSRLQEEIASTAAGRRRST
jgi:hypothetical protein